MTHPSDATSTPTATESSDLAEVLTWLAKLKPARRARYLAVLTNTRNAGRLAAVRAAAVAELVDAAPRGQAHAHVARKLGCSVSAVRNALALHRAHTREDGASEA